MSKTQRDLISVCAQIAKLERLHDRKVHLFIKLRAEGVTNKAIGKMCVTPNAPEGISDVGVINALNRHHRRHAQALMDLERARDDEEIAKAQAAICLICAGSPAEEADEPVAASV